MPLLIQTFLVPTYLCVLEEDSTDSVVETCFLVPSILG